MYYCTVLDAVVKFKVPMGDTQGVQIGHTVAYLTEDTIYLWTEHPSGHDDREEVIRGISHDMPRIRWGCEEEEGDTS